jgi:hypothetical protein
MIFADWFRIKQEDSPHDALRPQSFPRQQHTRCRPPPDAQQDLRRRVGGSVSRWKFGTNLGIGSHTQYRQERESKLWHARRNSVLRLRTPKPELRPRFELLVYYLGTLHGEWDC